MSKHPRRLALRLLTVMSALAAPVARAEDGNVFTNIFKYGGTTVPPSQAVPLDEPYCPTVDVPEGGAALRNPPGATGTAAVRSQTTLGRLARECTRLQDGAIRVKVGIEGHVLLGPAGAPGRFDAPLTIALKAAGKVVATRSRRVPVTVPPGAAQGLFSVIEDDLVVPAASAGNYDIEVRLGGSAHQHPPARRKPAAPTATSEAPVATPATEE